MIRSFLIFLPATLIPRIATFAASLIGAHLLAPTEFGYFAIVVVIGEISEMAAVGWTRVILIRYGTDVRGLSRANLLRVGSVSLAGLIVGMIIAAIFSAFLAPERVFEMTVATFTYVVGFSSLRIGLTILQVQGRKITYTIIESLRAPAYLAATLLPMVWTGSFFIASVTGSLVVLMFGLSASVLGWRAAIPAQNATIPWQTIRDAGVPIILILVFAFVVSSLDKTMLAHVFPKNIVAAYSIAFAFGRQGFDVLAYAINIGEFPSLVRKLKDEGAASAGRQIGHTIALILAVSLPAAVALITARDLFSELILPKSYWQAVHIATPLVAVGAILLNLKNFAFDNIFHVRDRNYLQLPTIAAGAAASIAIAILHPDPSPYISAALIFLSGALVSLFLAVLIGHRLLPIVMPWRSVAICTLIAFLSYPLAHFCVSLPLSNPLRAIAVAVSGGGAMVLSLLAFKKLGTVPVALR